jgi:hypothetical protein
MANARIEAQTIDSQTDERILNRAGWSIELRGADSI